MSGSTLVAIRVRLFGQFRQWSPGGAVTLAAPAGASAAEVRRLLADELDRAGAKDGGGALLARSALADDRRLIGEGWTVPGTQALDLALLPPVCGG
jgi:hypothetical protein